ncbi:hypothetical protein [Litorilituus lipolyticus]|uniref:Uncharacterized protein n=1 Tax=Litorilituus lipolyticus TaxID=2491017 RepID=A0A502KWR1_9GAMM|nr:hypothetical protein [Litorilituus lipolyticus]TPH16088.1 hypothetical protein EPA86_07290 [Litorilituus lipolyticus]
MQPDFSKYTLEELLDIEQNIDKDLYPERYEIVCKLIQVKASNSVEVDAIALEEKSSKIHRVLYVVGLFWFFAFYSIIKGEFSLKSYTATFADNPLGFFCGVGVYFSLGLYFYFMYKKQCNKLKEKE